MEAGSKIKVSVRLMVYNHEAYLKQAIESILMQKTNFVTEIVIGDDFSTDDSLKIALSFPSSNKFIIRVLERKRGDSYDIERKRLGRLYNFTDIISQSRGEFIALLDGDDYWSDPEKLQSQVDLLDSNQEVILCHTWHSNGVYGMNGEYSEVKAPTNGFGYYPKQIADVSKIFSNQLRCKSRTVMFRNVIKTFPDWFYNVAYGDVALSMILGKYGKFGFIDKPMAVYRQTGIGVSSEGSNKVDYVLNHYLNWVKVWEYGNLYHNGLYQREAFSTEKYFYRHILLKYNFSFTYFRKILRYICFNSENKFLVRLKMYSYLIIYYFSKKIQQFFYKK